MSDVDTIASEISLMVSGESHRVEILYLRSFSTGAHHRVAADLCSVFPDPVQGRTFPGLRGHSLFHLVKTNQAGRCLAARCHTALGHTWPLGHVLTSPSPGHRLLSGQLAQGGTRVSKCLSEYV